MFAGAIAVGHMETGLCLRKCREIVRHFCKSAWQQIANIDPACIGVSHQGRNDRFQGQHEIHRSLIHAAIGLQVAVHSFAQMGHGTLDIPCIEVWPFLFQQQTAKDPSAAEPWALVDVVDIFELRHVTLDHGKSAIPKHRGAECPGTIGQRAIEPVHEERDRGGHHFLDETTLVESRTGHPHLGRAGP